MNLVSIFSTKGGTGKTTLVFLLAAAIKMIAPAAKVGIIDMTSDQAELSGEWAPDKEFDPEGPGLWRLMHTLADPIACRRADAELPRILHESVTSIRVIPDRPEGEASIQLINTGRDLGKTVRDYPKIISPDASATIGTRIMETVADELGWDWCLLDLPGSIQDSLSRIFLPRCSAVIVPHDLRSDMNFHGFPDLMATFAGLGVPVSGFVVNQKEDSQAFRDARAILDDMVKDPSDPSFEVPVIGEIDTFLTIRKALKRVPEEELRSAMDAQAGLYRMLTAKTLFGATLNRSTRNAVEGAIAQVEGVARQIMATCAEEVEVAR